MADKNGNDTTNNTGNNTGNNTDNTNNPKSGNDTTRIPTISSIEKYGFDKDKFEKRNI